MSVAPENIKDIYCYSTNPPTTIEGYSFDRYAIYDITLHVEKTCIDKYKNTAPWKDFKEIVAIDSSTGINDVSSDQSGDLYFDANGKKLERPQKGMNIIVQKDGKVRKVIIK